MAFKVQCPACGKVAQFSASDVGMTALCVGCGARFTVPADPGDSGDPGSTLDAVPVTPPPSSTTARTISPEDEADAASAFATRFGAPTAEPAAKSPGFTTVADVAITAPPTAAPKAAPAPLSPAFKPPDDVITPAPPLPPAPPKPTGIWRTSYTVIAGALCGLVAMVVVGCLVSRHVSNAWQASARDDIRSWKQQAEALAAEHKFQQAYDAYGKIDDFVAGRPITDPDLRADVEQARTDREAMLRLVLSKTREQYDTVTLPRTTQPSSEQTTASTTTPSPPGSTQPTSQAAARALPNHGLMIRPRDPNAFVEGTENALTDEAIGRAIKRGIDLLLRQFHDGVLRDPTISPGEPNAYVAGLDALCVYALLQGGMATGDERLRLNGPLVHDLVAKMKAMPIDKGPVTYARALRATALAVLARPEDRPALMKDVDWLLASHVGGAYTYNRTPKGQANAADVWDNSNSQYGLLGVWSAAEIGVEVDLSYWTAVEEHWTRCQLPSGAWDYSGNNPGAPGRISMTLAGVASLFVTHDYLEARRLGGAVGREPFSKPLSLGLAYLESGDNSTNLAGSGYFGYTLYGLERVGLASGFKYFGRHDWYREQAASLIHDQKGEGSWGNNIETAYRLLFLARGRHPIVMNKLRYEGPWANRPRDLANLARFGSKELERPLNWQVVPVDHDWTDWMDSPILYLSTHKPVSFGPGEVERIRSYVEAGGMLFTQADGSRPEANAWFEEFAKQLFPAYPMADLPADHELFGVLYKPADRPPLRYVTNGSRILMLHSPTDITQAWEMRQDKKSRGLFELGMNLFLYASGKADLRNRISSPVLPQPGPPGGGRIVVARVKYDGNWDPEPAAWTRFSRYFQRETDVALKVEPTDLAKLNPLTARFAHWTGTARVDPTEEQIESIRKFVNDGGVILVEPTGGRGEFFASARAAILKAFPDAQPQRVAGTDALLNQSGPAMDDLSTPRTRTYVKSKGATASARLDVLSAGRGKVVLCPLDLTTGLLGCNTWGVLGYTPDYSLKLTKNVILWAETQVQ